jgi:hypothetical protein
MNTNQNGKPAWKNLLSVVDIYRGKMKLTICIITNNIIEAHPVSYAMDTEGSFQGGKAAGA